MLTRGIDKIVRNSSGRLTAASHFRIYNYPQITIIFVILLSKNHLS